MQNNNHPWSQNLLDQWGQNYLVKTGDGRWHYDVTDRVRAKAIEAGARPVDIREFGALISARRRTAHNA